MRLVSLALAAVVCTVASCASTPVDQGGSGGVQGSGGKGSGGQGSGGKGSGGAGSGGAQGTGGKGSGGVQGSGGSAGSTSSVNCADTSTFTAFVNQQYGGNFISVSNNSSKGYYFQSNWWGSPYNGQTEDISGLGFTMHNPNNVVTSNASNPLGFPSIFIGNYQSKSTNGSNLPKAVSALTSIPTIFVTNVDTMSSASFNASYDVWFTASNSPVTGSTPGTGGAYLMVWQFMPTDKYPRGKLKGNGTLITGVKGGWDVWYDNTDPPCVSYVSSQKNANLQFDLNNFIQDAVQNGYGVKSSQYLSIVFAGFEVWGGNDGAQVKQFCVDVK
jgi:Glycosyl hydrolase family 12